MAVPRATYRLQLHHEFTFQHAIKLIPYLRSLGISHVYLSPFLKARSKSLHGYDVVDYGTLNPEIGVEEDLAALAAAAKENGMGLLMDVVPNHMCITDPENVWWSEVLEDGPASPYAKFFDINWLPPKKELANKVLLPFLGDQYGKVLENGEIRLVYERGTFWACYYSLRLPLAPKSWDLILKDVLKDCDPPLEPSDPYRLELESIMTALNYLPPQTEKSPEKVKERQREKEVLKRRLAGVVESAPAVRLSLERTLTRINGLKGDPQSFNTIEKLLSLQSYRLCDWRVATDEINYRRFFDINDLAAVRVEDPDVFQGVHELFFKYVQKGFIEAARIDHVDGLWDPQQYLMDLQKRCREARGRASPPEANSPFYTVVEKILFPEEKIKMQWPVHGTTGYDFLNNVNSLFVNRQNADSFRRLYRKFTGFYQPFSDVVITCKKFIMLVSMASELRVLSFFLDRLSEQHRWSRDFTQESLRFALREVVACFPVYRSYIRPDQPVDHMDRENILYAIKEAKRRNPATTESIFDFIGSVLLLEHPAGLEEAHKRERVQFVLRFQQLTGPVMAKGLEDTAFYRYYPLASLAEVGGNPDRFGRSVRAFHQIMSEQARGWPASLSASSTHDTKRSEDLRARLNALSEIPALWSKTIRRWHKWNLPKKRILSGAEVPSKNEEYLFYQTLLGLWPIKDMERIQNYLVKAVREAKIHSTWIKPNEVYESAVQDFVKAVLEDKNSPFLSDFDSFQKPISQAGFYNALSQTLLKIACPGIPDFYQGTELWSFHLVDPDNRQSMDYEERENALQDLKLKMDGTTNLVPTLMKTIGDGRLKLFLIFRALEARKRHFAVFEQGLYQGLSVSGAERRRVVSFVRTHRGQCVIVAVGRFFMDFVLAQKAPLGSNLWAGTRIHLDERCQPGRYRDIFSGRTLTLRETVYAEDLFADMPAALLEPESQ